MIRLGQRFLLAGMSALFIASLAGRLSAAEPPRISEIPDQTTRICSPPLTIPFAVSDPDTPAEDLIVRAASSNTNLLANTNIAVTGRGADRALLLQVTDKAFGETIITLTVSAGTGTASESFTLSVVHLLRPIALVPISDQTIYENRSLTLSLKGLIPNCDEFPATFVARSGNTTLVARSNVVITEQRENDATLEAEATLVLTSAPDQTGQAKITVLLGDDYQVASESFMLNVVPAPIATAQLPLLSDTNIVLSFSVSSPSHLVLESTSDLRNWVPLQTNRSSAFLRFTTERFSEGSRFFRLHVQPPD